MLARPAAATLFAVIALAGLALAGGASGAAAGKPDEVCGTRPGDGAYSFVKVWNMSCDRADVVFNKVYQDFCDRPGRCSSDPEGGYTRGREDYRGWECKITYAYEFFRMKCERGDHKFVHEGGA